MTLSSLIQLAGMEHQLNFRTGWRNTQRLHYCQSARKFIGSHSLTPLSSLCFWWDCLPCLLCDASRMTWESKCIAFNLSTASFFFFFFISFSSIRVSLIGSIFVVGAQMGMKKKTRRLVGNTFMVMFSDTLQTCLCFVPSWAWVPSCSPCKLLYHSSIDFFLFHSCTFYSSMPMDILIL